ncbi:MAG TPA: TadE family protein [Candidatus Limnocylindrales bacterium]
MARRTRSDDRGQATVEFALAIMVFVALLMGIFDLGRGVYTFNAVAEAAREIARVTSVHPGATLGTSSETLAVIATQKQSVPGLGDPTFACVDIDGSSITDPCKAKMWVKVRIAATYRPATPLVGLAGPISLASSSSVQLP